MSESNIGVLLSLSITHLRLVAQRELEETVAGDWTAIETRRLIMELATLRTDPGSTDQVVRSVLERLDDLVALLSETTTRALAEQIADMAREVVTDVEWVTGEEEPF